MIPYLALAVAALALVGCGYAVGLASEQRARCAMLESSLRSWHASHGRDYGQLLRELERTHQLALETSRLLNDWSFGAPATPDPDAADLANARPVPGEAAADVFDDSGEYPTFNGNEIG